MDRDEPPATSRSAGPRSKRLATTIALLASACLHYAAAPTPADDGRAATRRRPNLLVIVTDDQSALTLGVEGDKHGATPYLDAFIRQGVYFDRAYCNSPVCTPSRQSFITGKLPHATGVTRLLTRLPDDVRTLGHWLGERGYRTAAIGKMHFNGPSLHGFGLRRDYPHWLRHLDSHPPAGGDHRTLWKPLIDPTPVWLNAEAHDSGLPSDAMDATYFVNRSIRFIKDRPDQPFALVASFYEPHAPFHFPREWRGRYRPEQFAAPKLSEQEKAEQPKIFRDLSEADYRGIQAAYYTSLGFVDEQIGRLIRAIDDEGFGDDTLVVFLSDHGYMLGQHGRLEKHCFYEPSVRTPLAMRWPGRLAPGRRVHEMVELVDVLPTILGLLEVPVPSGLHGRDFSELAAGVPGAHGRDVVCSEYQENEEAMARSSRYKLIVGSGHRVRKDGYVTDTPLPGPYERLYDEQDDPGETHDLAADPRLAPVKQELLDTLWHRFVTTWNGPVPIPSGLSRLETIHWCLVPRDKPNPGPPGHM